MPMVRVTGGGTASFKNMAIIVGNGGINSNGVRYLTAHIFENNSETVISSSGTYSNAYYTVNYSRGGSGSGQWNTVELIAQVSGTYRVIAYDYWQQEITQNAEISYNAGDTITQNTVSYSGSERPLVIIVPLF